MIDSHINWSYHVDIIAPKLSRAIGMLSKIRHYVSEPTLRSIYYGIFSSILTYGSQVWGQIQNKNINRLIKLQDKAVRTINFAHYQQSRNPLYEKSKILKFTDNIKTLNFLFVILKGNVPTALNCLNLVQNVHTYNTRASHQQHISLPNVKTQIYGIKSIKFQSAQIWNTLAKKYSKIEFVTKTKAFCKRFLTKYFLESYET